MVPVVDMGLRLTKIQDLFKTFSANRQIQVWKRLLKIQDLFKTLRPACKPCDNDRGTGPELVESFSGFGRPHLYGPFANRPLNVMTSCSIPDHHSRPFLDQTICEHSGGLVRGLLNRLKGVILSGSITPQSAFTSRRFT